MVDEGEARMRLESIGLGSFLVYRDNIVLFPVAGESFLLGLWLKMSLKSTVSTFAQAFRTLWLMLSTPGVFVGFREAKVW